MFMISITFNTEIFSANKTNYKHFINIFEFYSTLKTIQQIELSNIAIEHKMPDHDIEFMKKSKLVDIYYKIIIIMIENWENETIEKKKDQLKAEMMEYIDMFENAI